MLIAAAALAAPGAAEVSQQGTLRVSFFGKITPRQLPRTGLAPVAVTLGGEITTTDHSTPPQLSQVALAINRLGRLDSRGLPRCRYRQIEPSTTKQAERTCGGALVGRGTFSAHVDLPEQSPFPSDGEVVAFNGILGCRPPVAHTSHPDRPRPFLADSDSDLAPRPNGFPSPTERGWPSASPSPTGRGWPSAPRTQGAKRALHVSDRGRRSPQCQPRPVILAHIYGTTPLPQSQLLIFEIHRRPGAFGTSLVAQLPQVAAEWGYVSGIKLTFKRTFRYRGKRHSFVSAGCPAPKDLQVVPFSLARASFDFEDGRIVVSTIGERCRALE